MKNWITYEELESNLDRIIVYTTSEKDGEPSFREHHLPGSLFLSLEDDLTGTSETGAGRHPLPDMTEFAKRMMGLGIGSETPVLIYSHGLDMAMYRLWWMLKAVGAQDVKILYDADARWTAFDAPDKAVPSTQGTGLSFDPATVIEMDGVKAHTLAKDVNLIDSRDARRFDGIEDTMDHVPGHIPTAVNYPYLDLITSAPPSKEEIQAHFSALDDRPLVVYCGSGVSAPWNVLLLDEIDKPSVLYPGSFSDWITDPKNPIEK